VYVSRLTFFLFFFSVASFAAGADLAAVFFAAAPESVAAFDAGAFPAVEVGFFSATALPPAMVRYVYQRRG
jgi:hypothetical protein